MKFTLSDSLMCIDLLNVGKQLEILDKIMDWHHADIMDGHYCPNLTLSPDFVRAVSRASSLPIDVHLMTTRPQDWINIFAEAGASMITVHAETINEKAFRTIRQIRDLGIKVGVALNPATPFDYVKHYIDEIDRLTLMTVDVGYAGQPLVSQVIAKIKEAHDYKLSKGLRYEIQIDGCCNKSTYRKYAEAGADVLVMGSGLFALSSDLNEAVEEMRRQQCDALKGLK